MLPALHVPGTLKTYRMKIDIGDQDAAVWREKLEADFPDHDWRVRGTDRVVPGLQNVIARMETLLLLVSLGTLLIAGICVSNTVSTFLRTRINAIAMLKSLGMSAVKIRMSYLLIAQVFVVAGIVLGMPLGMFCQWLLVEFLAAQLPFVVEFTVSPLNMLLIPTIMLVSAWIFTIRPLHIFSKVSPTALFALSTGYVIMNEKMPRAGLYEAVFFSCALIGLLLLVAADRLFLLYFTTGGIAALLLFRLLAHGLTILIGKIRSRRSEITIALRLVARSGAQISTAAVSLGIGLSALLTFALTEANFNNQLTATLNAETPAYYLAGMQPGDEAKIRSALIGDLLQDNSQLLVIPILRAQITHLNKVPVDEIDAPESIDWIIHGNRYITWATDQTKQWSGASEVSTGEPWEQDNRQLLVSFDAEAAEGFGLEIGNTIDISILGQSYQVTIANLRNIDWTTFDVNFAMVLSGGPWQNVPHGYLGSVRTINGDHFAFQRQIVSIAPSITPIRTESVVNTATGLLRKVGILLNIITLAAVVSGVIVLSVAIAEGRHRRAHDSIVLRLLGISRSALSAIFSTEFLVIASLAALPSLLVALLASYSVTTFVLELPWSVAWLAVATIIPATLIIILTLGYIGTRKLIANPPLDMLRNE